MRMALQLPADPAKDPLKTDPLAVRDSELRLWRAAQILGSLTGKPITNPRFAAEIKIEPEKTLFSFNISFEPDKAEFPVAKYGQGLPAGPGASVAFRQRGWWPFVVMPIPRFVDVPAFENPGPGRRGDQGRQGRRRVHRDCGRQQVETLGHQEGVQNHRGEQPDLSAASGRPKDAQESGSMGMRELSEDRAMVRESVTRSKAHTAAARTGAGRDADSRRRASARANRLTAIRKQKPQSGGKPARGVQHHQGARRQGRF